MNKKLLLASVAMLFSSNVFTADSFEFVTPKIRIFYPDAQKPEKNCCRCHIEDAIPVEYRPLCNSCELPLRQSSMNSEDKALSHLRMERGDPVTSGITNNESKNTACCSCNPEDSIAMWARPLCKSCHNPFKLSGITDEQKQRAHERMLLGQDIVSLEEPWEADHHKYGIDGEEVVN